MSVTQQQVLDSLGRVASPRGVPLTNANVLSEISVTDGKVFFSINVDAAEARAWESVRAQAEAAVRAINEGEVYRFLLKPCHPTELQLTILQGLQHKRLVAQSRKLLQEHMKAQNLLDELEKANPGITKIEVDEDGAIIMEDEDSSDGDVQSLLNDLEREMSKVARR